MCGIAGSFGVEAASIQAMVEAMHHRGPDDRGVFEHAGGTLGMTRLAIVDTSNAGHQPMIWGADEVVLVFNGEIYNHRHLRQELELKGHLFKSQSDTEVVLHLYLEFGEGFVEHLRGMFAIALLDRRSGRDILLLARDHLGIKPLIYAKIGSGLIFASEIKALIASGVAEPRLNPDAVRQLLMRGAVCQPATMLAGVEMLMPGHLLRLSSDGRTIRRFWEPGSGRRADIAAASYPEQVDAVQAELDRIVREQMVADVPVGAFLSGGLDSSLLVALMAKAKADPIRTFSVGFGDDGADLDETEDALVVARHLSTHHTRVSVAPERVARLLNSFAGALDQPSVDGLNAWIVSEVAAQDVKVAISGTGGDELFAGYPWFRTMQGFQASNQERSAMSWAQRLRRLLPGSTGSLTDDRAFLRTFAAQYRHFEPEAAARLIGRVPDELAAAELADLTRSDILADDTALNRVSGLCLAGYTQNQLLRDVDATSMAHSIEVRVPFLDPDLSDIALSLPDSAKLGATHSALGDDSYVALGTKRILQDIARKHLPGELLSRPKRGFSMPIDKWLRGPMLESLQDNLRHLPSGLSHLIDSAETARVADRFLAGQLHWGRPWLLLVLCLWWQNVLKAAPSAIGEQTRAA